MQIPTEFAYQVKRPSKKSKGDTGKKT